MFDRQINEAVAACREAMADLEIDQKPVVLNELHRWLMAEAATHDPASAKGTAALAGVQAVLFVKDGDDIPVGYLRECFAINDRGGLKWCERPLAHFPQ